MCITIWKPEGYTLYDDTLKNCWDSNSDGAGFMYAEDGKVHIIKGLMTYDDFRTAYDAHKERAAVLHFRVSTHGKVDAANTHPFQVTETLGLTHNGIINNVKCDIDKDMSDTWHFVEKFAKPFSNLWRNPAYKALVEEYIGWSKLIMMDGDGNVEIYKESSGHWNTGCWFSNKSYENKSYTSPQTQKRAQKENPWRSDFISVGDECTMAWSEQAIGHSARMIPSGSKVRVESFGHGVFVWAICIDEGQYMGLRCKISSFGLTKLAADEYVPLLDPFKVDSEVVFYENYNHFRIGDRGVITSVAKESILVKDPMVLNDTKNYLVPKAKVRPAALLLN